MLFILPSCILACIACFILGFYIRGLSLKLKKLGKILEEKFTEPVVKPLPEEPQSSVIDPLDEVSEAIYARDQLMKKMNPE